MSEKPMIAHRTPFIVEAGPGTVSIGVNAGDRKRSHFAIDPTQERCSHR